MHQSTMCMHLDNASRSERLLQLKTRNAFLRHLVIAGVFWDYRFYRSTMTRTIFWEQKKPYWSE